MVGLQLFILDIQNVVAYNKNKTVKYLFFIKKTFIINSMVLNIDVL